MSPLLALLAFQEAPVVDPVKDPNLAKPITVHLAMQPLRTVVAAMAKESGQPVDVSGALQDWKATVLVKALPAGRTMEALADALGLVWRKDGAYFRLSRAEGSAAAEAAYVQEERADRQRAIGTMPTVTPGMNLPRRRPGRPGRQNVAAEGASATVYLRFDPSLMAMEGPQLPTPSRLDPPTAVGNSPFAKAIAAWPSLPKELQEAWTNPIAPPVLSKSPWEGGQLYSVADLLAAWHDASGLPVVADAFRVPAKTRGFNPGTAFDVLQGLANNETMSFRLADGVARLRHPAFWRLREQEISEGAWSAVERGTPTISSLASFAAGLKPAQVASFRSLEAPLSKVRTSALRDAYPALLLWSRLPRPVTTALLNGEPVALSRTPGSLATYRYALSEAPYYKAGDPKDELALDPNLLGFFGKTTANSVELRLGGERGGGVTYIVLLN